VRVALVHSFYASGAPSGENIVVAQEADALARAGHEVYVVRVDTDDAVHERFFRVRAGMRVATGRGKSPVRDIRDLGVDVVHVHNLFPNFGSRWALTSPAPVVHTLHNFRSLCTAGTFYREGHDCHLCIQGHPWSGVRFGCYRNSKLQSVPISLANRPGLKANPLFAAARRIIVMSDAARDIYARHGADAGRVVVKPHFLADDVAPSRPFAMQARHTGPWLYAGNLLPQKGVLDLVRRWPREHRLVVAGDGPLRRAVEEAAGDGIDVVGAVPRAELLALMADARGLVFPSRWLETFGMVYAEALACGLPVLAFKGSVVATQVRRFGTGHVVGWDEDLTSAVERAEEQFPQLYARCREHFERSYTEAAHLDRIIGIYGDAIAA